MIEALVFDGNQVQQKTAGQITDDLAVAGYRFWIAVTMPEADAMSWLESALGLARRHLENCLGPAPSCYVDRYPAYLYAGFPAERPGAGHQTGGLHLFLMPGVLVTVQPSSFPAVAELWPAYLAESQRWRHGLDYLFYQLVAAIVHLSGRAADGALAQASGADRPVDDHVRLEAAAGLAAQRNLLRAQLQVLEALAAVEHEALDPNVAHSLRHEARQTETRLAAVTAVEEQLALRRHSGQALRQARWDRFARWLLTAFLLLLGALVVLVAIMIWG